MYKNLTNQSHTKSILNNPFHAASSGSDFVLCIPLRGSFAHRPLRRKAKQSRKALRIMRRLWPAPQSTACNASPRLPLSQLRRKRPSFFR